MNEVWHSLASCRLPPLGQPEQIYRHQKHQYSSGNTSLYSSLIQDISMWQPKSVQLKKNVQISDRIVSLCVQYICLLGTLLDLLLGSTNEKRPLRGMILGGRWKRNLLLVGWWRWWWWW